MNRLILPHVSQIVRERNVRRIILMGDYTDQWKQETNNSLYEDDLRFLYKWRTKMIADGIEIVMLVGNHDVPYLIDEPVHYSATNSNTFQWLKEMLYGLNLQVAYQLDDYLISHAGYTEDYQLEDWHLRAITPEDKSKLIWLHNHVGLSRGGRYITGSPIWADLERDLYDYRHKDRPKQIVGHTPVEAINIRGQIVGVDTFSLTQSYQPIGNGDMLLYDNGKLEIVKHYFWKTSSRKINEYFQASNKNVYHVGFRLGYHTELLRIIGDQDIIVRDLTALECLILNRKYYDNLIHVYSKTENLDDVFDCKVVPSFDHIETQVIGGIRCTTLSQTVNDLLDDPTSIYEELFARGLADYYVKYGDFDDIIVKPQHEKNFEYMKDWAMDFYKQY